MKRHSLVFPLIMYNHNLLVTALLLGLTRVDTSTFASCDNFNLDSRFHFGVAFKCMGGVGLTAQTFNCTGDGCQ